MNTVSRSDAITILCCIFQTMSWNILGEVTLNYGKFLTAIINFLIMAFVVFVIVKTINTASPRLAALEKKPEETKTTKMGPMCRAEISIEACRCPQCTSVLDEAEMQKRSVQ